ncbi:MAG: sn-glycerol-3-phosphate ABC transporter ATP-binding protein UgpC [Bacteroidetes bacterium]|nr:sn-glycerol-3-phosphate ABC transporter ATP-binding protein UgpC [Bacteroidota bacterium]
MAHVELKNVSKVYSGKTRVVKNVNIEVNDHEFVVLVGPSGCGKSTTLRMVAGLEEVTEGEILIDGVVVNNVEPKDRDIAMVFQNYALYPHMTVFENMAFGLKLRKYPKEEINSRVNEAARILDLEQYLNRKPKALSGGQRQRVAVGRAIVRKPKVFLFDEPLSNLDAKLRVQMRTEISKLHNKLNATIIYVTHDQIEAMTMGSKIVLMKDGEIQQIGPPLDLYNNPVNKFVAGFIGSPSMNFVDGNITGKDNIAFTVNENVSIILPQEKINELKMYQGQKVTLGIRPEDFSINARTIDTDKNFIETTVEVVEPLGNETFLYFTISNEQFIARVDSASTVKADDKVRLYLDVNKLYFFDEKGHRIVF